MDLGWHNGRRLRKYLYGRTQEEVISKIRKAHTMADAGLPLPDERRTVASYLEWWATSILPTPRMKAPTADDYRYVVRRYVIPHVSKIRLAKLTPAYVHAVQIALETEGYSPSTVRYARGRAEQLPTAR